MDDLGYLDIDHGLLDVGMSNGAPIMTFEGKPFTGVAFEDFEDGGSIEVVFLGGVENGLKKEWYPNGVQKYEKFIYRNVIHGHYWEWYESGAIHFDRTYEFGIKTEETIWDETGNLISTFQIDKNSTQFKSLEIVRKKYRIRQR